MVRFLPSDINWRTNATNKRAVLDLVLVGSEELREELAVENNLGLGDHELIQFKWKDKQK